MDLPISTVTEISITLWCCACSNSLSKSSAVYVCELSASIIYVVFLSFLAIAAKGVSLTCLSLFNAFAYFVLLTEFFPLFA